MKNTWLVVLVVAVLIVVGIWLYQGGPSGNYPTASPYSYATVSPSASPAVRKSTVAPQATVTPQPYSDVVAEYADRRIQFNQSCQANPNVVSFKTGTMIMLDNRANQTDTISINGAKYTITPYGYQIVTLTSPSVPTDLGISCNQSVNVGTIKLQAAISQ